MSDWRDRTNAFRAAVSRAKGSSAAAHSAAAALAPASNAAKTPFLGAAQQVARDIARTSSMLQRLAELAKIKSLFNDPVVEIQQLTYKVKQEITGINRKLEGLRTMTGGASKQQSEHAEHVLSNLSSKLQGTTQNFQSVLELRAENLKEQQEQKAKFTGDAGLFTSPSSSSSYSKPFSLDDGDGGGYAGAGMAALQQEQEQALVTRQYNATDRLDAVEAIETTMVELGGIMQELAVMVEEQGHTIARIDDNVQESMRNVEGAQQELIKVLEGVMGNKKLILQMFLVFIVFLVIFLVFFV